MTRSHPISLDEILTWQNLCAALSRAARGKRDRPEVVSFMANWPRELQRMRDEVLAGELRIRPLRGFWIRDPKLRHIEAPVFRERVLHHALIGALEPIFERVLVDDTYACRKGKGCLAAVKRAQVHLRRNTWVVQVDVRSYYRSIGHDRLRERLRQLFRNSGVLALFDQFIDGYAPEPGVGIPIGTLISQHLGNFYLAALDRFLLQDLRVKGLVRYMDDLTWFVSRREVAKSSLEAVRQFADERLGLMLHREHMARCAQGIPLLGFRVRRDCLGLSARRRRRYRQTRRRWESAFRLGLVSSDDLQAGYSAALATTTHARASAWRRSGLACRPALDA